LITLEELGVALNRPIAAEEEPYYQYLIDSVTAYISSETGVAFSLHTAETVRYRADGRGIVEPIGPVVSVSAIDPIRDLWFPWDCTPTYDGLSEIYGLNPYDVVDVTYTYGYALGEAPEDIKNVAIEAVVGVIESDDHLGDLSEKTVGDITYKYRFSDLNFSSFSLATLNAYRGVAKTWRL